MSGGPSAFRVPPPIEKAVEAGRAVDNVVIRMRAGRTPAQIQRQMRERYAELEREAARRSRQAPCDKCRWGDRFMGAYCHHPLVKGFGEKVHVGMSHEYVEKCVPLCGMERALWEPKRNLLQRIVDWFIAPWVEERNEGL